MITAFRIFSIFASEGQSAVSFCDKKGVNAYAISQHSDQRAAKMVRVSGSTPQSAPYSTEGR